MLEIGSGTGKHAVYFAKALPGLIWLPSDPDAGSRLSIEAWTATEGLANVRAPVALDVDRIVPVRDVNPWQNLSYWAQWWVFAGAVVLLALLVSSTSSSAEEGP